MARGQRQSYLENSFPMAPSQRTIKSKTCGSSSPKKQYASVWDSNYHKACLLSLTSSLRAMDGEKRRENRRMYYI
ncbi:hypothetical protein [uncultured Porphyromonas sp.]|uniref:hypothetical protein n=1 Tax=uncultured Porphyromonas sp. TaxID=159274 RepID=UPI0026342CAB|nr:hypothetical protein [uncultured Porphyromonas sp.]